jgi:hypothetical protein
MGKSRIPELQVSRSGISGSICVISVLFPDKPGGGFR